MATSYFALSYRHLPETQFICGFNNKLRVRATRIKDLASIPLIEGMVGITEGAFFIFENISTIAADREHVLNAIDWFKTYLKLSTLRVVEIRR